MFLKGHKKALASTAMQHRASLCPFLSQRNEQFPRTKRKDCDPQVFKYKKICFFLKNATENVMAENSLHSPNVLLNSVSEKEYVSKIYVNNVLSLADPSSLFGTLTIPGSSQRKAAKS